MLEHESVALSEPREKEEGQSSNGHSTLPGLEKLLAGNPSPQRMRSKEPTERVTTTFAASTLQAIDLMADTLSLSRSATINLLVARGLAIEGVLAEGGGVYFRMADGVFVAPRTSSVGGWNAFEEVNLNELQVRSGNNQGRYR